MMGMVFLEGFVDYLFRLLKLGLIAVVEDYTIELHSYTGLCHFRVGFWEAF